MNHKLFFTDNFGINFSWKGHDHLRVGTVLPRNKGQISEGLKYMSTESIRNRFLGSKKAFTEKELEYLTVMDGWNHYAMGIEELSGDKRGVAIIRLVRSSERATEAEVAITIIDEYQKLGLGKLLLDLITLAAHEREIQKLSFTFLPQNEGIIRLIHHLGAPLLGPHSLDYVQLYLDLSLLDHKEIKRRLSQMFPELLAFPL